MKKNFFLLFALSTAGLFTLASGTSLLAQDPQVPATTTTTERTTTGPDGSVTRTTTTTTDQPASTPLPGQHVADIELVVSKGSCQAYFGNAARGEKLEVGSAEINIKLPSRATVTKIVSRDDDAAGSKHVTPDNPWHVTVPFDGPGRYVFNISDWDDAVVTACVVKVDGQVVFSGHGSEDDFKGWVQKFYAEGVRKTGSREIAFVVGSAR